MRMAKKGFTLIELLVVLAIIGLLSTLAVIALSNVRTKARDAKRLSDLKQIQTNLEFFNTVNNAYPSGEGVVLGTGESVCLNSEGFASRSGCGSNPYMTDIPFDPSGDQAYVYSQLEGSYAIVAELETDVAPFVAGRIQVTPTGIQNF